MMNINQTFCIGTFKFLNLVPQESFIIQQFKTHACASAVYKNNFSRNRRLMCFQAKMFNEVRVNVLCLRNLSLMHCIFLIKHIVAKTLEQPQHH